MDPLAFLSGLPGYDHIASYAVWAVALCALASMFLPAPTETSPAWWIALYRIINALGANRLKATNHDDVVAALPGAMEQVKAATAADTSDPAAPLRRNGMLAFALVALLPLLSACNGAGKVDPSVVNTVKISLTGAEIAARIYVRQPLCPQPAGAMCSDAAISDKIKAADRVAYAAVKGLAAGSISLEDANKAMADLLFLIPPSNQ